MKCYFLLAICVLLVSCVSTPQKRPPEPAPPEARNELAQIDTDLASGRDRTVESRLQRLILQNPRSDVANEARMRLGRNYYQKREFQKAYDSFMGIVNSDVFSPSEGEALLWAARSLSRLGRFDEALSLTDRSLRIAGISNELKLENYKLRFSLLNQLGDHLDALRALVYLAEYDLEPGSRQGFRMRAIDYVESRLNDRELDAVSRRREFSFVRGHALFKLGGHYFEQRDFRRARQFFASVMESMPDTDLAERAQMMMEQIDARRKVSPYTIGAVLPLTGRHAHVGYRTLRGLQLGLGIYGAERSPFRLAVIDSEGNPDTARRAVERLVTEDNVIAIVGSLMSRTAMAVATKSDELGVPSIALSQRAGLTDVGEFVFRNALTSQMQVQHLVRVAMSDLGYRRFAILYPNDAYGTEYANLFWDEVLARGGQVTGAQIYAANETDFSGQMKRLVGTYYIEDRQTEYRHRLEEWAKTRRGTGRRGSAPDNLLPPIVDFDAIFVPDGVRALGQIAPSLAYHDIRQVRLLGTNLWNNEATVQRGRRHVENALFVDGLLSSDPEFRNSLFFREYTQVFGEEPGLFETQAYDTGLLLSQLIAGGERTRVGLAQRLRRLQQFSGATGTLHMNQNRELIRPLVSLTVQQGQIQKFFTNPPKN